MSFLLENRLGLDITNLIKQFTKPKKISDYLDTITLRRDYDHLISKLITQEKIEFTNQNDNEYNSLFKKEVPPLPLFSKSKL